MAVDPKDLEYVRLPADASPLEVAAIADSIVARNIHDSPTSLYRIWSGYGNSGVSVALDAGTSPDYWVIRIFTTAAVTISIAVDGDNYTFDVPANVAVPKIVIRGDFDRILSFTSTGAAKSSYIIWALGRDHNPMIIG